ncbi:MAG TPA: MMPL family transporter [Mycobacteriales bacterium]|nr:MMPL family transporter [Mycobacteriales bacterium]
MLARLGSWSYRRRRFVMAAWAVLFVVGIALGSQVFGQLKDSVGAPGNEAIKGLNLMNDASTHGPSVIALVDGHAVDDPQTKAAVLAAKAKLERLPDVTDVTTAYDVNDPRLRSKDGRASLMLISVKKTRRDDVMAMHEQVRVIRDALRGGVAGEVKVGGDLAFSRDTMTQMSKDLYMGEAIALPILLVALVFIFRGVRVALIPLAACLVTVAGAMLLLLATTHVTDVGSYAIDVVTLFGLALAVDYSLLMANRFREERATGADVEAATSHTVRAAGRTITFSALTVIASLAGLFAFADPTFTSLAIGGIATVVIALAAGLTLVPALLATTANHLGHMPRQVAGEGAFGRLAKRVQRRPVVVAVATSGALVALALPFFGVVFSNGDPRVLPKSAESRQVADRLAAEFPSKQADPVIVVGKVAASDPAVAAYAERVKALPGVAAVSVEKGLRGNVSAIDVVPAGSVQGPVAQHLVAELRATRPAYPSYVTGQAASLVDFKHQIWTHLPYALGLIALATFALLFLMTGSVLVPIKALVMNTLSLGATFGALAWVFQDGHLSGLLGFQSFGAIEVWVPVVVFVFAFGLSMDYEVFLLSRIKECYDECGNSNNAVANGLQRSGRIITSAAMLVLIVFLGFAAGKSMGIKEMGLALAIAVAVDATIVRCLLVPATMTLLGERNWWAPAPMRRLYERYGLREAPSVIDITVPEQRQPVAAAAMSR